MKYLLDSNVIIDMLRGNENILEKYNLEAKKDTEFFICPIIFYEVVRGFKVLDGERKVKNFLNSCKNWESLQLSEEVLMKAAEIYVKLRKGQTVEDNDIFIAAVAIVNDCTLVTANEKHFSRIEELKFENWR